MRCALTLVVLACAGCGPHDALGAIHPVSARFFNINRTDVVVLGGGGAGGADLGMVEADGKKWNVPVSMTSGTVGAMMDFENNVVGELTLAFQNGDVKDGNDLLGTYQGLEWNAALLFGGAGYDLENDQFVHANGIGFCEGLGMFVGHVWMGVDVAGDVVAAP